MSSSSLDQMFSDLLAASPGAKASAGKAAKKITYAQDYQWKLHSFVAHRYVVVCKECGIAKHSGGEVFKKVTSTRPGTPATLTRLATLSELHSHPNLPRQLEVHNSTTLACLPCLFNLEFISQEAEWADTN